MLDGNSFVLLVEGVSETLLAQSKGGFFADGLPAYANFLWMLAPLYTAAFLFSHTKRSRALIETFKQAWKEDVTNGKPRS